MNPKSLFLLLCKLAILNTQMSLQAIYEHFFVIRRPVFFWQYNSLKMTGNVSLKNANVKLNPHNSLLNRTKKANEST
jgi:hypothetical protein